MDLAGGSLIFLLFLIAMFFIAGYELYTSRGSAIDKHPHHRATDGAPGASLPDDFTDLASFEEGVLHRGRRIPPKRRR